MSQWSLYQFLPDSRSKYRAYLRSREWGARRREVAWRSGGWCERCGVRRAREVHHRTYRHLYRESGHLDDLQHLCHRCHSGIHGRRKLIRLWQAAFAVVVLVVWLDLLWKFAH